MTQEKELLSHQIRERISHESQAEKSRKAFKNVVDACGFLEEQAVEITVAAVGAFCSGKQGGPAAQSIRNNKDLKAYVVARRTEQVLLPSKKHSSKLLAVRSGDMNVDAYIQTLEFELAHARSELRSLRQVLPRLGEYDLKTALESGHLVINPPSDRRLVPDVVMAIHRLLDPLVLESVGLVFAPTGQVIAPDQNDAILLSKAHTDALRKLMRSSGDDILKTESKV